MKISFKTMLSVRTAAGSILVASIATGASHASNPLPRSAMMQAPATKEDATKVKAEEQKEEKKEKEKDPCLGCGRG